jgi:hypothetical protein
MAKTQTITFKKAGSSWDTVDEAVADMISAIDSTAPSTDDLVSRQDSIACEQSLDGQTYTEVRTFTDDEYTAYKAGIDSIETGVADELVAAGWEITDTVE